MTTLNDLLGKYDNLDDPAPWINHKSNVYGCVITALIVTTICVASRLYVRFFVTRTPGYDDYLIIVTFVTAWAANVGCLLLVDNGLGQHFILLGLAGMADFTRNFWWCNALYNMTLASVKLSLLFQYLRLLSEHPALKQPQLRIAIIALIVIVSIWGLIWSIIAWVPSIPISADWDFTNLTATRWGYGSREASAFIVTFYNHAGTNMALDILVITLPLLSKSLWASSEMEKRSRMGMLGLFVVGGLSVICSIVRFSYIVKNHATTWPTFDPTWYGGYTTVLSVIEVDLATIAASLPVFWPHLRRNITSILVTHEVEIKVTRQSEFFGSAKRNTRNPEITGAHWDVEAGDTKGPQKIRENVMLKELNFHNGSLAAEMDRALPHRTMPQRSYSRLGPMSRESRDGLLKF